MTTIFRTRPAGWRERLALRLIGTTPVVANVVIGPDYTSLGTEDGRQILAHRMVFDVSDFERQIAAVGSGEGEIIHA